MLPPIYKNFKVYFKKDFIYKEVRDIFNKVLFEKHEMYEDIIDFINQSVVTSEFPGIGDTNTPIQTYDKGRTKEYQGGLPVKEYVDKNLPITFNVTNGYLNYIVLYVNIIKFLDHKNKNDKVFLPNIHFQILDDEDNIYIEFIYKNIKFTKLDPLSFSKQNNSILNTQFTAQFTFNDFDIIFHSFKLQSSRNSQAHEYDYLDKIGKQE